MEENKYKIRKGSADKNAKLNKKNEKEHIII